MLQFTTIITNDVCIIVYQWRNILYLSVSIYDNEMKKAKGIKKSVIKQHIRHTDYRDCVYKFKKYVHSMNMIRSEKHKLYTVTQNKTSLSAYDDKRYILDDEISTLPYGQYSLRK